MLAAVTAHACAASGCPPWTQSRLCTMGTEGQSRRGGERGGERKYQAGANLGLDDNQLIGMKMQLNLRRVIRSGKSHQVIRSPDILAALVTQPDVPAGGQHDGQGRLHAHSA